MALTIKIHEHNTTIVDIDPDEAVQDIFNEYGYDYDWYWDADTGYLCVEVPNATNKEHSRFDYVMRDCAFAPIGKKSSGEPIIVRDGRYSETHVFYPPCAMKKVKVC